MNGFWETKGSVRPDSLNWMKIYKRRVNFLLFGNQLTVYRQLAADCLSKSLQFSTFRELVQYPG